MGGREGTFFLIQAPIQLHLPLIPPPIKLNFRPTPPPIQLRKQQSPTQEFILVLGKEQATYKSQNLLSLIENRQNIVSKCIYTLFWTLFKEIF